MEVISKIVQMIMDYDGLSIEFSKIPGVVRDHLVLKGINAAVGEPRKYAITVPYESGSRMDEIYLTNALDQIEKELYQEDFKMKKLVSVLMLKVKKFSPEITLVAGIAAVGVGTVLACKKTLKCEEILADHNEARTKIDDTLADVEDYTDEEAKKDTIHLYVRTGTQLVKNYAVPAGIIVGGISLICVSHGIMKKRNALLTASLTALMDGMERYRARVREELGEEREHEIYHGYRRTEMETTDEKGKVKKEKIIEFDDEIGMPSQYAKFFDEASRYWSKDPDDNMLFLKGVQNMMNDKLKANGHVFLNEVYAALDIPDTPAGAICGWLEGNGDDYIDFGIFDGSVAHRRFVNGYEHSILLDFNVDGIIYDLI